MKDVIICESPEQDLTPMWIGIIVYLYGTMAMMLGILSTI